MAGKDALILTLAVLWGLTLLGWAGTSWWLVRRHRAPEPATEVLPTAQPRPQTAAEWALRTVADTAARVRERGLVAGLLTTPAEELNRWVAEQRAEIDEVVGDDGTVTLMFSDIENSTSLNERLGDDAWVRLLDDHDDVVRRAVSRNGGHVVKSQGDGFMVVFAAPAQAVEAAGEIQARMSSRTRRLRRTPVRLRIGIHVGTTVARDGDYFGRNVAFAARVADQAHGGQVLVTDDVKDRLGLDGSRLTRVGEAELKGLTGRHTLWALRLG